MSKKFNNKYLFLILIALAGIFALTKVFKTNKNRRTLNTELVDIDTAAVTSLSLFPKSENGEEIVFTRKATGWEVQKGEVTAKAEPNSLRNIFSELLDVKTERLVARTEDRWAEFQVNDSLGTRVLVKEGNKITLDMYVGRFSYKPPVQQYNQFGQQNYGTGISHVRLNGESEVFAVQGYMSMSLNQNFNSWRNQSFTRINRDDIVKIDFSYPGDSGFVAILKDSTWLVNGMSPDSAEMATWLSSISRKTNSLFKDGFKAGTSPDYQITINGLNMTPVIIRAYKQSEDEFILNSSQNPESNFSSRSSGMFGEFFKPENSFFPEK